MNNTHLKNRLGYCGLHCGKCFAFQDGDIARLSRLLQTALGNFDVYASRFRTLLDEPVFSQYPAFKAFLNYLTQGSCKGCRNEKCKLFTGCRVRPCCEQKGVDFCADCERFPCADTGFDRHLQARYEEITRQIRRDGAPAYYEKIKDKPRY